MDLYFALFYLVIQTIVCENEAKTAKTPEDNNEPLIAKEIKAELDPQVYKLTAQLLHMIHEVNNENNVKFKDSRNSQSGVGVKLSDQDYLSDRKNHQITIKALLKLLQQNYNSHKAFGNLNFDDVRVYYISNPDVLERYKKNLRNKDRSTSSSSSDEDLYDNDTDLLSTLRRQAFRLESPSFTENKAITDSEIDQDDVKVTNNVQQSMEDVQIQHEEQKRADDVNPSPKLEKNLKSINLENRKSEKASNEKWEKDDTWEMITKQYKQTEKKIEWDTKDTLKHDDIKEYAWSKKNKQSNNWDYDRKESPKRDTFDNNGNEKTTKKDEWNNDWNEETSKRYISDGDVLKKEKRNNRDRQKITMKRDWDDRGSQKSKKVHWDENNAETKKRKERKTIKDGLSKEINKKVKKIDTDKKNSLAEQNKKRGKSFYDWDRVGNDWDKPANHWDRPQNKGRERTTRRNWKNQEIKKINEWDNFMPKVKSKPKKHENFYRNGPVFTGFGRTPIPFIGRQGIYEDK